MGFLSDVGTKRPELVTRGRLKMAESNKQNEAQKSNTSSATDNQLSKELSFENESKSPKKKLKKTSPENNSSSSEIEVPKVNGEVNGLNITSSEISSSKIPWTTEEDEKLLHNVHNYLQSETVKSKVSSSKGVFLKDIDWKAIALCGEHTADDAKKRFLTMSNKVRKIRTAEEILMDMQEEYIKGNYTSSRKRKVATDTRDPDLPKKPISSFMRFMKENQSKVQEKHPQLTITEVASRVGKKWRKLSDERKKEYADRFHEELDEYNHKMVVYMKEHPHPNVKPPKSSFELWSTKEETKIKEDKPEISDKKLKKKLKRRWDNLEESEKTKWNEKERKEINSYKKRCVKAEKK